MWHRTCRWLGLDKGREQGQDTTTKDQHVEPEVVPKQQDSQSPVAFSPDCWIHQQGWLCEALRNMDKDQLRDPAQGASCQAPDSGVSSHLVMMRLSVEVDGARARMQTGGNFCDEPGYCE